MVFFSNITFQDPWILSLLALLPLMAIYQWRKNRSFYTELKLPSHEGFANTRSWRGILYPLLSLLRLGGLAFLIIALARPQTTLKEQDIKAEGIDIIMVIDLSSSMLAKDFEPDRLGASKIVAADFVDKRQHDRIGLVVFAGESFTQCPLTTDHDVLKEFLDGLRCGLLEDGTAIGMGLANGVNRLDESKSKSKVVILLTDGVNNAGYIQPMTAAGLAKETGVKVYTIGVGTRGEAKTPIARRGDGQYVFGFAQVQIDEELLQEVAKQTGGKYFRATDKASLQEIYEEIDRLEKTEIEVTTIKRYSEEFHWFLMVGMIIILIELLFRYTIFQSTT